MGFISSYMCNTFNPNGESNTLDTIKQAIETNRLAYLAMTEEERKERDCIRLCNSFAMVKELFPDLDSKRALIMAGVIVESLFK